MALRPRGALADTGRALCRLRRRALRCGVWPKMSEPAPRSGAKRPVLLVLAGPAGSGKSTLCDRLVAANMGFTRVVTSTTRSPRKGEANGVHYHFFTPEDFDRKVKAGEFLEWAWVHG